jgi:hypothetical protein
MLYTTNRIMIFKSEAKRKLHFRTIHSILSLKIERTVMKKQHLCYICIHAKMCIEKANKVLMLS